jgi:pSer/pThr/pTyr-binding forkhead associated (FHA) protein
VTRYLVDESGRSYPLQIGSAVLGRGDEAEIRLPDILVARRHARVEVDGDRIVITDLGSPGGTWVNDRLVSEADLRAGDVIRMGRTTVTLRVDD